MQMPYVPSQQQSLPMKWMFDNQDSIFEFQNNLRGMMWMEEKDGGQWIQVGERLVNEKGVKMLTTIILNHSGKNTVLSNLTMDELLMMCKDMGKEIRKLLIYYAEDWEIKKTYFGVIKACVMNYIFMALKRAENGFTSKIIIETTKQQVVSTYNDGSQKKGFLTGFLRR